MLRIHFTASDLARTRLQPTLGPLSEAVFAIGLLQQPAGRVHHRLRDGLARSQRSVRVAAACPSVDELEPEQLYRVVANAVEAAGDREARLVECASELWGTAIAPCWRQLSSHLGAEVEWRARAVMCGGVERLLSTLHPKITWDGTALCVESSADDEVHLAGEGVVLVPSVFLAPRAAVVIRAATAEQTSVLVFATSPVNGAQLHQPAPTPESLERALGELVGQTRAAVLRELMVPCFNNELAERLDISIAGASQHAGVLRRAGLISTRRFHNRALHSVTSLGKALLESDADSTVALLAQPRMLSSGAMLRSCG